MLQYIFEASNLEIIKFYIIAIAKLFPEIVQSCNLVIFHCCNLGSLEFAILKSCHIEILQSCVASAGYAATSYFVHDTMQMGM